MHRFDHFDIHFWSNFFFQTLFEHEAIIGFIYLKSCKVFLICVQSFTLFQGISLLQARHNSLEKVHRRIFFCFNSIHKLSWQQVIFRYFTKLSTIQTLYITIGVLICYK